MTPTDRLYSQPGPGVELPPWNGVERRIVCVDRRRHPWLVADMILRYSIVLTIGFVIGVAAHALWGR